MSLLERIEELDRLRDTGELTQDEYVRARNAAILASVQTQPTVSQKASNRRAKATIASASLQTQPTVSQKASNRRAMATMASASVLLTLAAVSMRHGATEPQNLQATEVAAFEASEAADAAKTISRLDNAACGGPVSVTIGNQGRCPTSSAGPAPTPRTRTR